ncbi:MAG TPA: TIGR02597 family protein [Candidatus Methylacidiphilales bacterium]|nr:TIGR02597 family protein [Candidatus Methylacidiphilales bacterium]
MGKAPGFAHFLAASLSSLLLLTLAFPLAAQTSVNTNPCGYCDVGAFSSTNTYIGLQANSDTLVSIPFTQPPAFVGTISSVSGNVVTVNNAPNWTANQFVYASGTQNSTYYALLGSVSGGGTDPNQGCYYTVTANGSNTLTLSLGNDNIGSVPANTQITLIPYWTLGTLFPASNANVSFTPSTTTRSLKTQILIPDYTDAGINLGSTALYFYINSGSNVGWRLFGDSITTNHSDDILNPYGYIIVRNQNSAPTLPLVTNGYVSTGSQTVQLATLTSSQQDNAAAIIQPVGVTLDNSGLSPSNGSFTASTSTRSLQDQLLFYNNSSTGINQSASALYYYISNGSNVGWRLFGDSVTTDHGNDVIPAGSALTIRKAATNNGATVFWTSTPTY